MSLTFGGKVSQTCYDTSNERNCIKSRVQPETQQLWLILSCYFILNKCLTWLIKGQKIFSSLQEKAVPGTAYNQLLFGQIRKRVQLYDQAVRWILTACLPRVSLIKAQHINTLPAALHWLSAQLIARKTAALLSVWY